MAIKCACRMVPLLQRAIIMANFTSTYKLRKGEGLVNERLNFKHGNSNTRLSPSDPVKHLP
jgi:hypothetical protein